MKIGAGVMAYVSAACAALKCEKRVSAVENVGVMAAKAAAASAK